MTGRVVNRSPGPVCRWWWILSEPFRLLLRLVSERWLRESWWYLAASALRLTAHVLVGNWWWVAGFITWLWVGPSRLVLVLVLSLLLALEIGLVAYRATAGRPTGLTLWRMAWRFHRQWPRVWADCAAKTREIQGLDGSRRGESRASAIRLVVDHPRMPWRFWFRWPVITFRVGVAPGRTFAQFERVIAAMGANMAWVHALELDYGTDRDSFALLHVALGDVLVDPGRPEWIGTPDGNEPAPGRPELRVIDGEAS